MYSLVKCVFLVSAAFAASAFNLENRDVVFHLFTRQNPQQSHPMLADVNSIMTAAMFSLSQPTIFTIHSHGDSASGNFNAFLIPAHLASAECHVISIDWSVGSSMYSEALGNAPQAGQIIANFINILINSFNYNPNLIRIVGVGLGGHIAGIAARQVNGNIPHIVALDPSLVGWTHHSDILNPDDADVVEVLHTTAGSLGYDSPLGDLDFYPNGGALQNGCGNDVSCSHTYAYAFYAESLTATVNSGNEFVGTACESYEDARTLRCSGERDATFGGVQVKSSESGIYIFLTNFVPPFARG